MLERLQRLAPWPVTFLDPAPAIARRVVELIGPAMRGTPATSALPVFTSGRTSTAFMAAMGRFAGPAVTSHPAT